MAGKNGKKGGGLFWIPGRSHHRHKNHHKKEHHNEKRSTASIASQKGPTSTAVGTAMMTKAMMSGDSPDHCRTDPLLDLKDKPVACTSNGNATRPAAETIQATVSVEPRPKAQEAVAVCGPAADATSVTRRSRSTSTEDEIEMAATPLNPEDKHPTESGETLSNAPIDATDSDPTKINNLYWKKENAEQEEEGCGVKCLYYTLQCCECTIM